MFISLVVQIVKQSFQGLPTASHQCFYIHWICWDERNKMWAKNQYFIAWTHFSNFVLLENQMTFSPNAWSCLSQISCTNNAVMIWANHFIKGFERAFEANKWKWLLSWTANFINNNITKTFNDLILCAFSLHLIA